MARYNTGKIYNSSSLYKGFNYNNKPYVYLLIVSETSTLSESWQYPIVNYLISYKITAKETFDLLSNLEVSEKTTIKDEVDYSIILEIMDSASLSDSPFLLTALLEIMDKPVFREEIEQFNELFANETLRISELTDIKAILSATDRFKLTELNELFAKFSVYEQADIFDTEPKTAISDFYIDADGLLSPFDLRINFDKTTLPFMPEAVDTSIEISGTDGELVQSTKYNGVLFNLFAYTLESGLSYDEKQEIKEWVAEVLHSVKNSTKKMGVNGRAYDVKYSGSADISVNAPGWLEFNLPLKSASPYSRDLFEEERIGSGLIRNTGVIPTGVVVEIKGEVTDPSFNLNGVTVEWKGTVSSTNTLVIDTEKSTAKLVYRSGYEENAMAGLTYKNFPKAKVGNNNITFNGNIGYKCKVRWINYHLN